MVWGHFVVVAAWWSSDFNFFEFFRRVAKVGGSVAEEWRIGGGGSAINTGLLRDDSLTRCSTRLI